MECALLLHLVQHVIYACKAHSFVGCDAVWCSRWTSFSEEPAVSIRRRSRRRGGEGEEEEEDTFFVFCGCTIQEGLSISLVALLHPSLSCCTCLLVTVTIFFMAFSMPAFH
jgi:hypothetical protein